MKARNLVLGLMLASNVLTTHSAMAVSASTTSAIIASHNNTESSEKTMASTVSSTIINSQNTVIVECPLKTVQIKKDGEWFGSMRPSLKETIESSRCQWNKEAMEQLNNTHYEFGKVKGIFDVRGTNHVMIELVEVNE